MEKTLKEILSCPKCKNLLIDKQNNLFCKRCKNIYEIFNKVPVFLDNSISSEIKSVEAYKESFKKIKKYLSPPLEVYSKKIKMGEFRVDKKLAHLLKENKDKLILNIGSSPVASYNNCVNLDIGPFEGVNIVADGKCLPFKENKFDLVIIEMVLEHVDEPEKVILEANRVLKKGGKVFISIPFVFVFHGSPDDFNRFTLRGLKKRLENRGFNVEDYGILSGPGSMMSQMIRYYLALLFSFNNKFIFSSLLNIFGWLTFPLKYTDVFLNKYQKAHLIASSIYAIGKK